MMHSTRSLASLVREGLQTLEYRKRGSIAQDEPNYLLLAQQPGEANTVRSLLPAHSPAPSQDSHTADSSPKRQEILNYLGELAKDYHLPEKLVYAVADAESSINPSIKRQPNYVTKHGKKVYDRNGNAMVASWDYGLMQINDKSRLGETVRDPKGQRFKIGEDVKSDWKANARAAVAILSQEYGVAETEQGPGATAEDRAQQTYSGYTHSHRHRDLYLKERHDGLPANGKDRNFLGRYRKWAGEEGRLWTQPVH